MSSSEMVLAHLENDALRREVAHWKKAAAQRGQTMNEALAQSLAMLERAMAADAKVKRVEAVIRDIDYGAAMNRGVSNRRGGRDQMSLLAAECKEAIATNLRVALGLTDDNAGGRA